jgi:hypothetical protein
MFTRLLKPTRVLHDCCKTALFGLRVIDAIGG